MALFISFFTQAQQLTYENLIIEGVERHYYQYLPIGYDPNTENLPLVFALHGLGDSPAAFTNTGFNEAADTARFIAVYPEGLPNSYGDNSWNNGTLAASNYNDVLLFSTMIDTINNRYGIDLSRVYMTGVSGGSIMTYKTIRHLNDRIAAVSCHIGTMSTEEINGYNPTYPVPVQHLHGTADASVPYDSNPLPSLSLVPETINKLKVINGCNGDSTIIPIPDRLADGITIDKIVYDCSTPLELWKMYNCPHLYIHQTYNDTGAVYVSWYWFRQFSHPNPSMASLNSIQQNDIKVDFFPNPNSGNLLFIRKYYEWEMITFYDIEGRFIYQQKITDENVDITPLSNGLYIIELTSFNQNKYRDKLLIQH